MLFETINDHNSFPQLQNPFFKRFPVVMRYLTTIIKIYTNPIENSKDYHHPSSILDQKP